MGVHQSLTIKPVVPYKGFNFKNTKFESLAKENVIRGRVKYPYSTKVTSPIYRLETNKEMVEYRLVNRLINKMVVLYGS